MAIDILLVNPVFMSEDPAEQELKTPYFPLGLLYLAAFLRNRNFQVRIFDGTFADGMGDFTAALDRHQPQIVGVTAVLPNRQRALALANLAKKSGATVILGGPDPTTAPHIYLDHPAVDFVVHHEGELTLAELMEILLQGEGKTGRLDDIPGLAFRDLKGQVVVTQRRAAPLDLDQLPEPARDLVDIDRYLDYWRRHHGYASLTISVSRGCPYGCDWCLESVHGNGFRQRSPESVVAEVKGMMSNYSVDRLRVVDDVDGLDREWIEAWAELAAAEDGVLPFEALYELQRQDLPMLDIRDSL